ncbi:TadE/TadG family type IV pilus assembly protein [Alloyangia pacifica]|uniref:TadE/TadG family type IV pilus assembly protein n=1 Tax=Alloyangia pacifica TaxID=311180 RepID=UPI001CFD46A3|nr:pilus assembly protein TadG-related protein [Alloyangia pacifica]
MKSIEFLRKFRTSESGVGTVMSVCVIILTLIMMGAAIDVMHFEERRARVQNVMDSAALAAADLDQERSPKEVVEDYLTVAGLEDALSEVTVTQAANSRTVSVTGASEQKTVFMRMSGVDLLGAGYKAIADERVANVEISLALDVSGSMRWNNRMERTRTAAKAFLDKVVAEDSYGVTTLNVIPFAGGVNPGDKLFDHVLGKRPIIPEEETSEESGEDFFDAWPQAISNFVMYFDTDGDQIYDVAHKIEDFPEDAPRDADEFFRGAVAYVMSRDSRLVEASQFLGASIKGGSEREFTYYQVSGDNNGPLSDIGPTLNKGKIPGETYFHPDIDFESWATSYPETEAASESQYVNMPSSCLEIYDAEFSTTALPQSGDYIPHFHYWPIDTETMDWGWCPGEDTSVQYYQHDIEALSEFIDNMRMHDGTGLHYAMKYALALLDPANRDSVNYLISEGLIDSRFADRPIDWQDPETEKYVVLMTDGTTTEQYRPVDPQAAINGEVTLQDQGEDSYYMLSEQSANVDYLMQQCDLAKEHGVTVFTVAFETSTAAAADMRACASSVSHAFHVTGDELYSAFDMIARQINNLRLIQ